MFSFFTYVILIITCKVYASTSPDPAPGKCVPVRMSDTIGLFSVPMGVHGTCQNLVEIDGFKQCRGYCDSADALSKLTGKYEQTCRSCRVQRFTRVPALLTCEDGEEIEYNVPTPDQCECRTCGDTWHPDEKTSPTEIQSKPF